MLSLQLETGRYYHLYNRSNSSEPLFTESRHFEFFLSQFRLFLQPHLVVVAYCLMPDHFHFIVRMTGKDSAVLEKEFAKVYWSYAHYVTGKLPNGGLFGSETKARLIDDEQYLLTLITFVHQNPVRANLVRSVEKWNYSSYPVLAGIVQGEFPNRNLFRHYYYPSMKFRKFSEELIPGVKAKYWV